MRLLQLTIIGLLFAARPAFADAQMAAQWCEPAGGVGVADATIFPATADDIAYRSTSGATQTVYPLVGANHAWNDVVTYLSSQEGLIFASVIGDLAD